MLGISKNTKKRIRRLGKNAEFYLTVACDVYVILMLAVAGFSLRGNFQLTGLGLKVVWVSLLFFGLVRVIVAVARGHRVVE